MAKYFTREEAETLLPQIEPVLVELQQRHAELEALRSEIEGMLSRMRGNGHGLQERLGELRRQHADGLAQANNLIRHVQAFGCQLKDPAMGLIDFLALRAGREILLCWRLGEQGIHWWHEVEAGFRGRQPLE